MVWEDEAGKLGRCCHDCSLPSPLLNELKSWALDSKPGAVCYAEGWRFRKTIIPVSLLLLLMVGDFQNEVHSHLFLGDT